MKREIEELSRLETNLARKKVRLMVMNSTAR